MYAVIEQGGKQYRVELGTELAVDRMAVEAGESIEFPRVLLVADGDDAAIGRPVVDGARVTADVLRQARGDKIVVFKYRPKARRRVKQGARADLTILRISDIVFDGRSAAGEAAAQREVESREAASAAAAAEKQAEADKALAAKLAKTTEAARKPAGGAKGAPEKAAPAAKTGARAPKGSAGAGQTKTAPAAKAGGAVAAPGEAPAAKPKAPATAKPKTPAKPAAARTQAPAPETTAKTTAKPTAKPTPRKKKEE
ncbi:MAG TPA: 50S ribosomal protein L21 [Candidatus Dormibacteraeota bacterium]|nr:50S ribosomal protein L21 [Candidatus Dormibacteraeota bacterium]